VRDEERNEELTPSQPASDFVPDEFETIRTLEGPKVETQEFQESYE